MKNERNKEKEYSDRLSQLNLDALRNIKKLFEIMEEQGALEEERSWSIPCAKIEREGMSKEEARSLFHFAGTLGVLDEYDRSLQKPGCITLTPPIWEEPYVTNYKIFLKVLNDVLDSKSKNEGKVVLYFTKSGDLYREPKDKYLYQLRQGRIKILEYILNFKDHQFYQTKIIASELGKNDDNLRKDIGDINSTAKGKLDIENNIIEGKEGSGYRLNLKYKIVRKKN